VLILSIVLDYGAGFGLKFIIITMTIGFALFFAHERVWNMFKLYKDGDSDTPKRSLIKTISWRILSFIALFIVGMVLGLSSESALVWTVTNNLAFIIVHYLHERLWNRIKWGRT
jgi:uncharacterized membrane protein